jgi:2-polyprenyl-3-methyl-5-hydroxy-6-metoxy-1,4-benzoquinol methylase
MSILIKREYFNQLAPAWDQLPGPPDAPARIAEFSRRAVPDTSQRVLDVGCGTGVMLAGISRPDRRIVALDVAENMLRQSLRKFGSQATYVCADAVRLPFAAGAFDAIVCFGVLPHIQPLRPALTGLVETLASGGTLTVGHLMGSTELNAFHAGLSPAVSDDRLLSAKDLADTLVALGLDAAHVEERPDWYFVQCRRAR